jgi:Domain of unknown function (DUF4112)
MGVFTRTDRRAADVPAERVEELRRLRDLARLLDSAFEIPGTNWRIGWDSLVGLVPVVGDLATGAVSAAIVARAAQLGVPRWQLVRMAANVGIDLALGAIPFVGDAFDFVWKANNRNVRILERYFERVEGRSPPQPHPPEAPGRRVIKVVRSPQH